MVTKVLSFADRFEEGSGNQLDSLCFEMFCFHVKLFDGDLGELGVAIFGVVIGGNGSHKLSFFSRSDPCVKRQFT